MSRQEGVRFRASYDRTTKILSAALPLILLVVAWAVHRWIVAALGAAVTLGAYAWSPRRYWVDGASLVVERLIGNVSVRLDTIREARAATADDLKGCIRLFGSGGMFGYYGLFRTSKLGSCTWYVTNPARAVVVVAGAKTLVVSPDDMDAFLAAIRI